MKRKAEEKRERREPFAGVDVDRLLMDSDLSFREMEVMESKGFGLPDTVMDEVSNWGQSGRYNLPSGTDLDHEMPELPDFQNELNIADSILFDTHGNVALLKMLNLTKQLVHNTLPLGKPILRNDGLVVVGTTSRNSGPHPDYYLIKANFYGNANDRNSVALPHPVLDLKWIDDRNAVAAFGSNVQMLKMPESSNFLLQEPDSMIGSVIGQHQSELREVAVCDASPAIIASGGYDRQIQIHDVNAQGNASQVQTWTVNDTVSSIRWGINDPKLLSWTTDGGDYNLYDTRSNTIASVLETSQHPCMGNNGGLFTHANQADKQAILLGFQNGRVASIDTRMRKCLFTCSTNLHQLGDMALYESSSNYALFGLGGFSMASITSSPSHSEYCSLGGQYNSLVEGSVVTAGDYVRHQSTFVGVSTSRGELLMYDCSSML